MDAMSQRPARIQRQVEWRVIAISEKTPKKHAQVLQETLNTLTIDGFNIVSMSPRGAALIITSSRIIEPPPDTLPAPPNDNHLKN